MHRALRLLLLAVGALVAIPAQASADTLLSQTVTAAQTGSATCAARPAGGPSIVQRRVAVPVAGMVNAKLNAGSGDWDVAIFEARNGRVVSSSAAFGANELAGGFVSGASEVIVQACRRKGDSRSAQLQVTNVAVPSNAAPEKASLLKVNTPTRADKARLQTLGLDLTEHAGHDYIEVLAYGTADRRRLREAGFTYTVETDDLVKADVKRAVADRAFARQTQRSNLPSGRDGYRRLGEVEAELKALAERYPNLVRPLTLQNKSVEGRDVLGIEVTDNAQNVADGKPVFLQMGVHHAREWPSGEMPMEFANDLVKGFGSNERITNLLKRARVIFVPVVNVDGFNVSREATFDLLNDPAYDQIPDKDLSETAQALAQNSYLIDPFFNYKRRNCRVVDGQSAPPGACTQPQFRTSGVAPTRNYGGFWGGPGASFLPQFDTYRGPDPFSEPETRNIQALVSSRQVTGLITNHTFSNLILRPPGIRAQGPTPDEPAYKALGDEMAKQNGYFNDFSYGLYDTSGTTEDWSYFATGGFGFTFEIGPDDVEQNCGGFHPRYECVIRHYTTGQDNGGGGNREAYLIALEHAADASKHSTLTGKVPRGVTLRVKKDFLTETSPVRTTESDIVDGGPSPTEPKRRFKDELNTTMTPGGDGRFTFSINPSTRPVVAANRYRTVSETPTRTVEFSKDKQTTPNPSGENYTPASYEDETFDIRPDEQGQTLIVTLQGLGADDYDIELFRRDATGLKSVGTSAGLPALPEEIVLEDPQAGQYVLRVYNFLAAAPYTARAEVYGLGPEVVKAGSKEAWTFTCEVDGQIIASRKISIDRGQRQDLKEPCGENAEEVVAAARGARSGSGVCASAAGFRSTRVKPVSRRRKVRFGFARRVPNAATVEVFQVSQGRKIIKNRRVATFRNRLKTFTWDGTRGNGKKMRDGVFFVRYRIKGAKIREDFRRATLVRKRGKFSVRKPYYKPKSCGLLYSVKLGRPVFGGSNRKSLSVVYRVRRRSNVRIVVRRGKKVVRTFRKTRQRRLRTHRVFVGAKQARRRGMYKVTITAKSGRRTVRRTLYAERL